MITLASRTNGRVGLLSTALLLATLGAFGCQAVEQDDQIRDGGTSPDPTAVLEGSILYSGPKPQCKLDEKSGERRVSGSFVLLLYFFNNPPFPEGNAASSENLLIVSGDQVFAVEDCLPDGTAPNFNERIARSVPFRWPGIALIDKRAASYQIRGFYDYDEDFIPQFSATRQATAGDIMGAAMKDVQNLDQGLLEIPLPAREDAVNGFVTKGITFAVGSPVLTERPIFKLNEDRRLSSLAPFEVVMSEDAPTMPDPLASLRKYRGLTCPNGSGDGVACGLSVQPLPRADEARLAKAAVEVDLDDPERYTTYVQGIDLKTVNATEPDVVGVPDGVIDDHPVLGRIGVKLYSPLLMLARQPGTDAASIETSAGIPAVRLLGSVVLEDPPPPLSFSRPFDTPAGAPMAVPPVAIVELVPNRAECNVPYFPPGTAAALINANPVANCGELPTGTYSATVVNGVMGTPPDQVNMSLAGTLPSFQSWTVPNELGAPEFDIEMKPQFPEQGQGGVFTVASPGGRGGSCPAPRTNVCKDWKINPAGVDSLTCLPEPCCEAIEHLCDVKVCEPDEKKGPGVAGGPKQLTGKVGTINRRPIPDCVPFEMPKACCAWRAAR